MAHISRNNSPKVSNIKFNRNPSSGIRAHARGQTVGHEFKKTKQVVAARRLSMDTTNPYAGFEPDIQTKRHSYSHERDRIHVGDTSSCFGRRWLFYFLLPDLSSKSLTQHGQVRLNFRTRIHDSCWVQSRYCSQLYTFSISQVNCPSAHRWGEMFVDPRGRLKSTTCPSQNFV